MASYWVAEQPAHRFEFTFTPTHGVSGVRADRPQLAKLMAGPLAAEFDAIRHGALAPLAGTFANKLPVKFGNSSEVRGEEPALRRTSVLQRVAQRPERGNAVDEVEQLTSRAAEPIELGNDYDVASLA